MAVSKTSRRRQNLNYSLKIEKKASKLGTGSEVSQWLGTACSKARKVSLNPRKWKKASEVGLRGMLCSLAPWRPAGLNTGHFNCLRVRSWDQCLFLSLLGFFPLHFVSDTLTKNHERICTCTQRDIKDEKKMRDEERRRERIIGGGETQGFSA